MIGDTAWQARAHRRWDTDRCRIVTALIDDADADDGPRGAVPHPSRKLANKLTHCCRSPQIGVDEGTGELVIGTDSCRSRVCPRCSLFRGRDLREHVRLAAMRCDAPAFLTLTLRSSGQPLRDQLDRLTDSARRLRRRRSWRSHVSGGIQVVEVTWSQGHQRWHPHIHALIDTVYWPQAEIADEWEAVTGDSRIVDIRRLSSRTEAANYVAKYCAKGVDLAKLPSKQIAEAAHAMAGKRMAQTFGHLHGEPTKTRDASTRSATRWMGWLAELWEAADQGDPEAVHLRWAALYRRSQLSDRDTADLIARLDAWYAARECRSPNAPATSSRLRNTAPQTRSNPVITDLFDEFDPPPIGQTAMTGPPR